LLAEISTARQTLQSTFLPATRERLTTPGL